MTRLHLVLTVAAIASAGAYAACSKTTPEPDKTTTAPAPEAPTAASAALPKGDPHAGLGAPGHSATGAAAATDEVSWDAPTTWTTMPNPSPMRKATYKIAKAVGDAEDAELTVTAASGGVDANVTRWAGQFGNAEPKKESKTVN